MNEFADQRLKVMADQLVQVFESVTSCLAFLSIIMLFNRFYTGDKQKEEKSDEIGDLKLEAQQVKEFNRNSVTWQK